jgi:hypothetical protein
MVAIIEETYAAIPLILKSINFSSINFQRNGWTGIFSRFLLFK